MTFNAEIEYFTTLLIQKEIKNSEVLTYHAMQMLNTLIDFKASLSVTLKNVRWTEIDISSLRTNIQTFQTLADYHLEIWLSKLPGEDCNGKTDRKCKVNDPQPLQRRGLKNI